MRREFALLSSTEHEKVPFPAAHRRPDWRSSAAKRLLRNSRPRSHHLTWEKKMAVVIDEAFFASLVGLAEEKYLSNSEIAWFGVGYDQTP